jgi:multiple sugar transport system substrate-binding protein
VWLGARLGLALVAAVGVALLPAQQPADVPGWPAPPDTGGWHNLVTAWERWDGLWFLRIASDGYSPGDLGAAFFPLYPLAIRAAGTALGGHPLAGALVVSNLAFLGALVVVYLLTRHEFDRDLAPPETWEEYNEIARFFRRPDQDMFGAADLVADGWAFWWWQLRYASQEAPNAYYFDDDMTPLIDGPSGIRAMELLVELRDYMPRDLPGWDWTHTYQLFADGQAAQKPAFGALAKFVNDPSVSDVVGQFSDAPMPGTMVNGELIRRSIFAFGNSLAVWAHSEHPEQAYLFAQWITSPEMSARMTAQPGFSEPYRLTDVHDEAVRELYTPSVMDNWIDVVEITAPEIMLRGAQEYGAALDRNVMAAFVGSISPEEAMANTAREWNDTTDRLGREEQAEAWQFLKQMYPGG